MTFDVATNDASDRRLLTYSFDIEHPRLVGSRVRPELSLERIGDPGVSRRLGRFGGSFDPARGTDIPDCRWSKTTVPLTLLSPAPERKPKDRFRRGPVKSHAFHDPKCLPSTGSSPAPLGFVSDPERATLP
jgi:hypothetical protein